MTFKQETAQQDQLKNLTQELTKATSLPGLLGLTFGVLSIFAWGMALVPLGALLSIYSLTKKAQISKVLGFVGLIFCIIGFFASPELWTTVSSWLK